MRLFRLFKKDMAQEVGDWINDGLIDTAQGEAILARYGASLQDARGSSLGYYVLTALAALFVGLALILILSHNWDQIPRAARMVGLCFLTLGVNTNGIRLMLTDRYNSGVIWLFFGSICYGATIMLIGQIYHIGEHFPDGIFFWSLGILPLIFITRSRLIALLCLGLATIWMFVEAQSDFFPMSYPFFVLAALWLAWLRRDSAFLFISALCGLMFWINFLLAWYGGGFYRFHAVIDQFSISIGCGLLLTGVACRLIRLHDVRLQNYGYLLHLWILRVSVVLLLMLSFDFMWRALAGDQYIFGFFSQLFILISCLVAFYLSYPSGLNAYGPILGNGLFYFLCFLFVSSENSNNEILAASTNLMLVLTSIWLVRRGIDDAITHYFYTGVGLLLLTAMFRYFDLIGDYIGGAILFIIAAAIMFVAAKYWRYHLEKMEKVHD